MNTMDITNTARRIKSRLLSDANPAQRSEPAMLLLGKMAAENVKARSVLKSLSEAEFKVFSQWGDDGIIQWLAHHLPIRNRSFVEFGVESYREANTRFLMMNDNWSGLVIDGSPANVAAIQSAEYFWQYELQALCAFIDKDNINGLIGSAGMRGDIGILHIDLDGNDYWIWQAIDVVTPELLILEYNAVFGAERAITTPYDASFQRTVAHHSNLYFGASLRALYNLSHSKGYAFIGCNSAGNNAYFVRRDRLNDTVCEVSFEAGYVPSKFREGRDAQGRLTHISGDARLDVIRGLPVFDVQSQKMEPL
jgi:hypothetical protein